MGEAVGVKYHSDDGGSPAPTKNVVKLLQYLGDIGLGYSNIALSPITTDKVRDMIFVKKLPFYYSGKSSTNSHAWVLDGWLLRERRVITRYAFCLLNTTQSRKNLCMPISAGEDKKTDTIHSMRSIQTGDLSARSQ